MTENQAEENLNGSIGERLLKLIKFYGLNMNSISTKLELPSNSVITRIIKDSNRGISLKLIQKILFEFRDINTDWFVMGRGEMFKKKQPEVNPDLLSQKDEIISNLRTVIQAKDEVISAKNDLIANFKQ